MYSNFEEHKYQDFKIFNYTDFKISGNNFYLSLYSVYNKESISPLKLKININNFQRNINVHLNLSYQEIFELTNKIKILLNNIDKIKESNKILIKRIIVNETQKLEIKVCKKVEFDNNICFAISLYVDQSDQKEIVYFDENTFYSIVKLLTQFRDNYINYSFNTYQTIYSLYHNENLKQFDQKLTRFYLEIKRLSNIIDKKDDVNIENNEEGEIQNELDSFIVEKKDDFKIEDEIDSLLEKDEVKKNQE